MSASPVSVMFILLSQCIRRFSVAINDRREMALRYMFDSVIGSFPKCQFQLDVSILFFVGSFHSGHGRLSVEFRISRWK